MTIAIIAAISIANIICFFIGAKIGQTVVKNKEIKAPNPVKAVREYKESKEEAERLEEIQTMLHNIAVYDCTELGQKEI